MEAKAFDGWAVFDDQGELIFSTIFCSKEEAEFYCRQIIVNRGNGFTCHQVEITKKPVGE